MVVMRQMVGYYFWSWLLPSFGSGFRFQFGVRTLYQPRVT